MARTRAEFNMFLVLFLCVVCGSYRVYSDENDIDNDNLPSQAQVNLWARLISENLITKLDRVSGVDEVNRLYKEMGLQPIYVNGSELVLKVANKWQEMLRDKMVAVENIVENLENAFKGYTYNDSLEEKDVDFHNAKNMTNITIELTYNDIFKSEVNTNYSSVQIPTDIWSGDKKILNGIKATNTVDEVFRKNYEKDPQLLWQYFGSADGFYRSYPAAKWMTKDPGRDQYDVRRRGWYIQAASSPKDVMILVDRSGSTFGMTMEITKVSVYKALDTLGNDDFVNVAWFNDKADFVSCFKTFVQANLRNKNHLKDKVKHLKATGVADFKKGLEMAFEAFKEFRISKNEELNQGAECHQVILIFTDGGEADEKETFLNYNVPVRTRVFVFKVGTDSMVASDGVREMACLNKGYFSSIQSFGAVRLTTLAYVPVLSRPMVLSNKKHFQWSDIYLDVLGLGMMTTLTRPVYNKTGEDNQQMLAVVGTDITTKNMEDTVPQRKPGINSLYKKAIGPEGYAFGINSNGYILLHPRLKAEEEIEEILELGYLTEPPNVDFLEVEYEIPEKTELRIDMINQNTGQKMMSTPIMSHDERYLEFIDMTYSYTYITNTTFSVAIAQPKFGLWEWNVPGNESLIVGNILIGQEEVYLLIAPWEFCQDHVGQEGNITTENITKTIQRVVAEAIKLDTTLEQCDDHMVRKLLLDANITNYVAEYWKKEKDSNPDYFKGVIFNTVATNGGVTRIFPDSAPKSWTDEEIAAFQDPWDQAYYQRALYTKDYVFAAPYNSASVDGASMPVNETYLTPLMVSKAVHMQKDIKHSVVAVSLTPGVFNDVWIEETKKGFNDQMDDNLSCANERIHCYLLDDGGFIIATNQEDHQGNVGSFFGIIDGNLMYALMNTSIYNLMTMNDFQAACPRQKPGAAAAGPKAVNLPTISDVINFNTWAVTASWSFLRHFLWDVFFLGMSDLTYHQAKAASEIEASKNVSCIKILKQYYFGGVDMDSGDIDCMECTRLWRASRINGTNLLLVVSQNDCEDCPVRDITQVAKEPGPGEGPDPCEAYKMPRYRKRPTEHCYDFFDGEDDEDCSSAVTLRLNLVLLLALQLLFFLTTRSI